MEGTEINCAYIQVDIEVNTLAAPGIEKFEAVSHSLVSHRSVRYTEAYWYG